MPGSLIDRVCISVLRTNDRSRGRRPHPPHDEKPRRPVCRQASDTCGSFRAKERLGWAYDALAAAWLATTTVVIGAYLIRSSLRTTKAMAGACHATTPVPLSCITRATAAKRTGVARTARSLVGGATTRLCLIPTVACAEELDSTNRASNKLAEACQQGVTVRMRSSAARAARFASSRARTSPSASLSWSSPSPPPRCLLVTASAIFAYGTPTNA